MRSFGELTSTQSPWLDPSTRRGRSGRAGGARAAGRKPSRVPAGLAGNCDSCLGTTPGAGTENLGVVWLDAHADFDDPEENESGFFDVMGRAMRISREIAYGLRG
jgi:arginase family enzyme